MSGRRPRFRLISRWNQALVSGSFHVGQDLSCNPATLHANIIALGDAFHIRRFALFDQFPFTPHIEFGVLLRHRVGECE